MAAQAALYGTACPTQPPTHIGPIIIIIIFVFVVSLGCNPAVVTAIEAIVALTVAGAAASMLYEQQRVTSEAERLAVGGDSHDMMIVAACYDSDYPCRHPMHVPRG